ncbi:hypothetical protein [Pendulispora albinea]|uniref:Uncharacterized protein n=1 Tax=Pendulispora albinea TaxID=2741071 RepID=A0ABZ2M4N3_9BACT
MKRRPRNGRRLENAVFWLGVMAMAVGAGCALVFDIDPDSLPRESSEAGAVDAGAGGDARGPGPVPDGGTEDARGGAEIPAFVGASTAKVPSGQPIVVNRPAETVADDVLLVALFANGNDNKVTLPAMWTLLDESELPCAMSVVFAYHTVEAAPPASYTFALRKTTFESMGTIVAYRGVNPQSPIDAKRLTRLIDAGSAYTSEGIASSRPNAMLVFLAINDDGTDGTWKEPERMKPRVTQNVIGIFDALQEAAGPSGARTAFPSPAGCGGIELTFLAPRLR